MPILLVGCKKDLGYDEKVIEKPRPHTPNAGAVQRQRSKPSSDIDRVSVPHSGSLSCSWPDYFLSLGRLNGWQELKPGKLGKAKVSKEIGTDPQLEDDPFLTR